MAEGAGVVIGGTSGIGHLLATEYAAEGRTVVISGRDIKRTQEIAAEIGGDTAAIGVDLAEPETIAPALGDIGPVAHLVIAAIERDVNSIRDYDKSAGRASVDPEARRLPGGREHPAKRGCRQTPPSSCSVDWPRSALTRLDDGQLGERRRQRASCARSPSSWPRSVSTPSTQASSATALTGRASRSMRSSSALRSGAS